MTAITCSQPTCNLIETTAHQIFDSFTEAFKRRLNGRKDRALKLAIDGHVTHKAERVFSVRSENGNHSYLVDLTKGLCTCPDYKDGNVCKHRLAAYLVEQAMAASQKETEKNLEILQGVFEGQLLKEAIVYAAISLNGQRLPVEVIGLAGEVAEVRALPLVSEGVLLAQFPFAERSSKAKVLARSLMDIVVFSQEVQ